MKKKLVILLLLSTVKVYANNLVPLYPNNVCANSYLYENEANIFHPYKLADANISTSYVESVIGNGVGTKITYTYFNVEEIIGIEIANGFQENRELFDANSKVKRIG